MEDRCNQCPESKRSLVGHLGEAGVTGNASAINHWEEKNDRACGMITFSTEQGPRVHIGKIEIATKMWSILKDQYEQSDLITLHLAIRELTQSKQSDFKSIQDYADSLKRAATRCSNAGEEVPD